MQSQSSTSVNGDGKIVCDKVKYGSREQAIDSLHTVQNVFRGKSEKIPVRAYECHKCKGWHLTSKDMLTENAKAVKLKKKDQWESLIKRQETREYLYGEKPFEKQFEKALSIINHNIDIKCEVLNAKYNHRVNILNRDFNRGAGRIQYALKKIKERYNIPNIKVYPKNETSKLSAEMDTWVIKLSESKRELTADEARAIIAHYIK